MADLDQAHGPYAPVPELDAWIAARCSTDALVASRKAVALAAKGLQRCPACDGKGAWECEACEGEGTREDERGDDVDCPACDDGMYYCDACECKGTVPLVEVAS